MRLSKRRRSHVAGMNMTPMIDIVFLLIIFFLVSSHLARQENRLPLNLPVASTHDPLDPERAPLTISVNEEAKWLVGGDVVNVDQLRSDAVKYLKESQLPWTQLFEEGGLESSRLATEFGVQTLPTMMLINQDGKVVRHNVRAAELDDELDELARNKTR